MKQIKITILVDLPEGMTPDVDYGDLPQEPPDLMPQAAQIFAEELKPLPRPVSLQAPTCPLHGPMTRFPAGTNKAGKPYNASWRCSSKDCATKPIWDRDAA